MTTSTSTPAADLTAAGSEHAYAARHHVQDDEGMIIASVAVCSCGFETRASTRPGPAIAKHIRANGGTY